LYLNIALALLSRFLERILADVSQGFKGLNGGKVVAKSKSENVLILLAIFWSSLSRSICGILVS